MASLLFSVQEEGVISSLINHNLLIDCYSFFSISSWSFTMLLKESLAKKITQNHEEEEEGRNERETITESNQLMTRSFPSLLLSLSYPLSPSLFRIKGAPHMSFALVWSALRRYEYDEKKMRQKKERIDDFAIPFGIPSTHSLLPSHSRLRWYFMNGWELVGISGSFFSWSDLAKIYIWEICVRSSRICEKCTECRKVEN